MPTYEYRCTSCGHQIEVFQRITEEALTTCGVCGGPLRKVFHPAGIMFKGSGFYATDSRTSPEKTTKKESDGSSKSGGDTTSDGGSTSKETKPASSPSTAAGKAKGKDGS